MSDLTLHIPDALYQRARKIAEKTSQPVDDILLEQLQLWAESVPLLDDDGQEAQRVAYIMVCHNANIMASISHWQATKSPSSVDERANRRKKLET